VDGLVGLFDVHRVTVRLREDRYCLDTHTFGSSHHTKGNLTTIGNEDLLEELWSEKRR